MPSQRASSKKVYITHESPRRSNESISSQYSSDTSSTSASSSDRYDSRYRIPASSKMSSTGSSSYSGSTSTSGSTETRLRVPDDPRHETISKKSNGGVDVINHRMRWEVLDEPRSGEAKKSDYHKSSRRHKE